MSEEQSFKSRLSDVFGGLDQVKFKSDSSLKQEKYEENKVDQGGFRVPRSPANSPSSRGGGGGSNRTVVRADRQVYVPPGNRGRSSEGTREPSKSFDRFKKTDSIFQESQDVGSWKQRESARDKPPSRFTSSKKPKNPMYDHRRPQRKDPSKYTKYSLADVQDVTDRSNTMAALDFLNHVKKRSNEEEEVKDTSDSASSSKVVFKKPTKTNRPRAENDKSSEDQGGASYSMASCGNSKRVMPEAVVGRQANAGGVFKRKTPLVSGQKEEQEAPSKKKAKEKKLSHLDFGDEDEDASE